MAPSEENNRLEDLKRSLYSRSAPDVRTRRKLRFGNSVSDVQTSWQGSDGKGSEEKKTEDPVLNTAYEDHSMSFFTKLLIGSFIFALLAIGGGAYLFFNGSNLISADNISVTIDGPVSIPGGTPVSFDIHVVNNNNVALQLVDLNINFPAGATDPNNPTQALSNIRELLGTLAPGAATTTTVSAIIFGEENIQKEIDVALTYGITGSTAVFTKTQTYDVLLNSSPISLTASAFKEITSGQEFDTTIVVKSNSASTLQDVLLRATYPFGYTFLSANLPPLSDGATWRIGDIPPGGSRTIVVHGKLVGEDSDNRAFHWSVGAGSSAASSIIGTEYMSVEQDMTIQKPFVSLALNVNNDTSTTDYVANFGQTDEVQISWFNNLSTAVSNVVITAKLSGSAYAKTFVSANGGYFDSAHDSIVWNEQTTPALASVGAGQSGNVSFIITPQDQSTSATPVVNPTVLISTTISGNRTQETNVPETLSAAASRSIDISSTASLSGRVVRASGQFPNSGPIPPKAEQATTYTVVWTVDNTANSLNNAVVTASLPASVKWLGQFTPSTEDISYDSNSGIVTWNLGSVGTYTGGQSSSAGSSRREVDFQISYTPGVDAVGTVPNIVNEASLAATDSFTNAAITSNQDPLTTRFSTDPGYKPGNEVVSK